MILSVCINSIVRTSEVCDTERRFPSLFLSLFLQRLEIHRDVSDPQTASIGFGFYGSDPLQFQCGFVELS